MVQGILSKRQTNIHKSKLSLDNLDHTIHLIPPYIPKLPRVPIIPNPTLSSLSVVKNNHNHRLVQDDSDSFTSNNPKLYYQFCKVHPIQSYHMPVSFVCN